MDESIAHPDNPAAEWAASGWKTTASSVAAILLAILFVVAGVWKITDPFAAGQRLAQARVPADLSVLAACLLGVAEASAGALAVVPRFRRWGAAVAGLLLLAFMIYIAAFYSVLRGEDCNCFPWITRAVGPGFFIGDGVMLALAVVAGLWARPSRGLRSAVLVVLAISVFAAVSYGVSARTQHQTVAPASITVDGRPYDLHSGRILLYFYDPTCLHCNDAAQEMSKLNWNGVKIVGLPTEQPQFAQYFMDHTGLRAPNSPDAAHLRKTFSFASTPYAVALENGREKAGISDFDPQRLEQQLRQLGFLR